MTAFLFTDIEGSTRLWERDPRRMARALARHDALLRAAIEAHGGRVFKTVGDALYATFAESRDGLAAAAAGQASLAEEDWGDAEAPRVRMAVHSGGAEERDGDFYGPTLNRLARILAAGHGGQVLVSAAAAEAVGRLPDGLELVDLGEFSLRDLALPERLFQLAGPGLTSGFPPLRSLGSRPNNLPAELQPLIGRAAETASLERLLLDEDVHLVTLTGPGGIGKTRLALRVATALLPRFPSGVYYVSLADARDPGGVAAEIAHAIGLREAGGEPLIETPKEHLRDRRMLLVLDNFEQVLSAAPVVGALLRASPGSKALVTSRAALRLSGEHELGLQPLVVPPTGAASLQRVAGSAAVELFVERARGVRPSFALDETNAGAVAEICRRLDGLPLAIELAAARVRTLAPAALLSRLDRRLQLLTGGPRDLPARQQTLRDAIAWSYDLLSEPERDAFAALSAFAGGFTLAAAERVCGLSDPVAQDTIEGLVQASLLRADASGDDTRFAFLETIHDYARERLERSASAAGVLARHLAYVVELVEGLEPHLRDSQQVASLSRLEAEHENVRAGLRRSLEAADAEAAARLGAAAWRFWLLRAHLSEGRTWLERALASAEGVVLAAELRVKLLTGYGVLVRSQGDLDLAETKLEEALALAREERDQRGTALASMSLGVVAYLRGDYGRARELHEESLALWRGQGDAWGESVALTNLALVAQSQGELDRARGLYEASLRISRELGDRFNTAVSLHNLGNVMLYSGDEEAAQSSLEEAVELRRDLGDPWGLASALHSLGLLALRRGDRKDARRALQESLLVYRERGDKEGVAISLEGLASVAGELGEAERLARLYGAAEALRERIGAPLPPVDRTAYERRVSAARTKIGASTFAAAWREGRELTMEQAIAVARPSSGAMTTGSGVGSPGSSATLRRRR